MPRFSYCGCHVTIFGIFFDFINLVLFLLLLCGTLAVPLQDKCSGQLQTIRDRDACGVAIGILVSTIVLALIEVLSVGALIGGILYDRGELMIAPLIVSYINIALAAAFAILSIVDVSTGNRGMAKYIWTFLFNPNAKADDESEEIPILDIAIILSSLLVLALLFCLLNAFVHTRIWQFYKWKRKHDEGMSDSASQVSIIATFSMSMVVDEWRRRKDESPAGRAGITSIAEEDEEEEMEGEQEREKHLW